MANIITRKGGALHRCQLADVSIAAELRQEFFIEASNLETMLDEGEEVLVTKRNPICQSSQKVILEAMNLSKDTGNTVVIYSSYFGVGRSRLLVIRGSSTSMGPR